MRQIRFYELPHVTMIDYEQRSILSGIGVQNRHAPVVEDQPMLILAYGKYSVFLSSRFDSMVLAFGLTACVGKGKAPVGKGKAPAPVVTKG